MINFKAVFIAAILCMLMPMQSSGNIPKYDATASSESWWNLLYPQFSGSEIKSDDDIVVKIKLVEILKQH
jgi:hypothetical protein